jgi:hypothetical protein
VSLATESRSFCDFLSHLIPLRNWRPPNDDEGQSAPSRKVNHGRKLRGEQQGIGMYFVVIPAYYSNVPLFITRKVQGFYHCRLVTQQEMVWREIAGGHEWIGLQEGDEEWPIWRPH